MRISQITAWEILDSRGFPTLAVRVTLASGAWGEAMVPSGASTGSREAVECRDHDPNRYRGKGVLQAIAHVTGPIQKALKGKTFADFQEVDAYLCAQEGTPDKSRWGANALLGVSMACARAQARATEQPVFAVWAGMAAGKEPDPPLLPVPLMNILNGGVHADNQLDIQECMVVPAGAPNFAESVRYGAEIFHVLKALLHQKGLGTGVGDEGGFAPALRSTEEALDYLMEAITQTGLRAGTDVYLALDVASSEWYRDGYYHLQGAGLRLDTEAWIAQLVRWVNTYPLISLEDPMAEDDWTGFQALTAQIGDQVQLVGDDMFTTQVAYLEKGIAEQAGNAILIKPNQVGTLGETLLAIRCAQKAGWGVVVSHRSGETEDPGIADLAFGTRAGQIKTGSLCRSERLAKYNQLLRLAQETDAPFAGTAVYARYLANWGPD